MTTATAGISVRERAALRSAVKTKMQVLRREVRARETELLAQVEEKLAHHGREQDGLANAFRREVEALTASVNAQLTELTGRYDELFTSGHWQGPYRFNSPSIYRKTEDKDQLRRALVSSAKSQAAAALLRIAREESDLLMDLAMDALETSAARAFLGRIPSLDQLLPETLPELPGPPR